MLLLKHKVRYKCPCLIMFCADLSKLQNTQSKSNRKSKQTNKHDFPLILTLPSLEKQLNLNQKLIMHKKVVFFFGLLRLCGIRWFLFFFGSVSFCWHCRRTFVGFDHQKSIIRLTCLHCWDTNRHISAKQLDLIKFKLILCRLANKMYRNTQLNSIQLNKN